jgi:hypothetical protein
MEPSDLRLAPFQAAAVEHIIARLTDQSGSRRFLLADEVGLGKTIVARGVIDAMARKKRNRLTVVYLCSNAEIAEQNRGKLVTDRCPHQKVRRPPRRITDLAIKSHECEESSAHPLLLAFTPGTSLSNGTGTMGERRLLLYLLKSVARRDIHTGNWREFFRCSAGGRWADVTTEESLGESFGSKLVPEVRAAVRTALYEANPSILKALDKAVENYKTGKDSKARNSLVGELRQVVQHAILKSLQPHLVVLDEVQRFRHVIGEGTNGSRSEENVAKLARLLMGKHVPVLVLSATPFRTLSLNYEAELHEHLAQFRETLTFLFAGDQTRVEHVLERFEQFGRRLRITPLDGARDEELWALKRELQGTLLSVMCRTERSWYYENTAGAIQECCFDSQAVPNREELHEFFDLHRTMGDWLTGAGQVTDYWKSSPSMLSFIDSEYALSKKLKGTTVPRRLVSDASDPTLIARNHRLGALVDLALGKGSALPPLWTTPSFTYYEQVPQASSPARKVLVFSGWRFVPKAISVIVSAEASRRFKRKRKPGAAQPLRLRETFTPQVLDTCVPLLALARLIQPADWAMATGDQVPYKVVLAKATHVLREELKQVKVTVAKTSRTSHWQAAMRLESRYAPAAVRKAIAHWHGADDESSSLQAQQNLLDEYFDAVNPPLVISEASLQRLAWIALASPAVTLTRALVNTYGEDVVQADYPLVWNTCFNAVKRYFNRPFVQAVVQSYRSPNRRLTRSALRGYGGQVLQYCADHQLQAVWDEHAFLLRTGIAGESLPRALKSIDASWSVGTGSRRTNVGRGKGPMVKIAPAKDKHETHFALAFGDELDRQEAESEQGRMRKSDVREAFNSPFWPFVLATTSVGQEGLDFHYHCRDVFHWNLPSNPVDLEQREGRVSRRNGLAVRASIRKEWHLPDLSTEASVAPRNPWLLLFERLDSSVTTQRYKQGLYPHWIYECRNTSDTEGVRRHVAFFKSSRDSQRYERLKQRLALYRIVFGQSRQEDLLDDLDRRLAELPTDAARERARRMLRGYMMSLSPVTQEIAEKLAEQEADDLLKQHRAEELVRLIADVMNMIRAQPDLFAPVAEKVDQMCVAIHDALADIPKSATRIKDFVKALAYLRNPYDGCFDGFSLGGFDDDLNVIRRAKLN